MAPSKESFRLSTQDASFLYSDTSNGPLTMGSLGLVHSRISLDSLIAYTGERMYLIPRYRQRVVFAPFNLVHPSLEDDPNFDLANHIFSHEMPRNSTEAAVRGR